MSPGGNSSLLKIDARSTNKELIGNYSGLETASLTMCRKTDYVEHKERVEVTTVPGIERTLNLFTNTSF